jgi:hypothetical protein
MSIVSHLLGLQDGLKATRSQAGKGSQSISRPSPWRRATILTANAGVYSVAVAAADGGTASTIAGVQVWGSATFNVGDRVWLVYEGDRPVPFIMGAGGGGGAGSPVYAGTVHFF